MGAGMQQPQGRHEAGPIRRWLVLEEHERQEAQSQERYPQLPEGCIGSLTCYLTRHPCGLLEKVGLTFVVVGKNQNLGAKEINSRERTPKAGRTGS